MKAPFFEIKGIGPDSWIEEGAEIKLPWLISGFDRVQFKFNHWRPSKQGPAIVNLSFCNSDKYNFVVSKEHSTFTFDLSPNCSPAIIKFNFENAFRPSLKDRRNLGVKLEQITVSSKLGPVFLTPRIWFGAAAVIFILSFLTARLFTTSASKITKYGVPLCASLFGSLVIAHANPIRTELVLYLCATLSLILIGVRSATYGGRLDLDKGQVVHSNLFWMLLAFITLLALTLRFYGLDFGLPATYHSDEPRKVAVMTRMIERGTLNPNYFLHPSLLLYSSMLIAKLLSLLGFGEMKDLLLISGRSVSAFAGTFSVTVLGFIGSMLFTRKVGLLAAAFLAFAPLHVTCSRYMKEDALFLFFLLLSLAAVFVTLRDKNFRLVIVAGLFAGLSASSKYTGILCASFIFAMPFLAAKQEIRSVKSFFTFEPRLIKPALLGLLAMVLGFVLATPYSILNYEKFLEGFGSEGSHMMKGHTVAIDAWSQLWMYHLSNSILPGFTWSLTVFALLGLGLLLSKLKREELLVLGLCLLFYMTAEWVKAKPAPQPERYILPCLPFLALAAANYLERLRQLLSRYRLSMFLWLLALIPLIRSLELASELRNDTRQRMQLWAEQNLPAGSKILVNGEGYAPSFDGLKFEVAPLSRQEPEDFTISALKNSGYDYLVLSSLAYGRFYTQHGTDPYFRFFKIRFNQIFAELELLKEIKPTFGTYGFHNPVLRIYSLKDQK